MRFDDVQGQWKPEPRASDAHRLDSLDTMETLEDAGLFVAGDTDPLIDDVHECLTICLASPEYFMALPRRFSRA
jgi:hypothetical protein